ncbi:MAG: deoxynucleoside kinase [Clostridiales bacterium]|nr:deoxynucleoside kinase [Clostridiales bacterium]
MDTERIEEGIRYTLMRIKTTGLSNFFVEGLQGAGKSTMVKALSDELPEYEVFREGDYSPVELAWCAYVTENQYRDILAHYPALENEITRKTIVEGDHRVICYTQILTDVVGFHKDLEHYEIYNGNLDEHSFEKIIFERYERWNGKGQIFESSIFQNIIENQMLYLMLGDERILDFYSRLKQILSGKQYQIIYLDVDDILSTIELIKKERSDENGNELWFPLMVRYIEESPYGKEHSLHGMEGLLTHLERRKALEHRIINEIFKEETVVVKSKNYNLWQLFLTGKGKIGE